MAYAKKITRKCLIWFTGILLANTFSAYSEKAVIGGGPVQGEDIDWVCFLIFNNRDFNEDTSYLCTAALIAPQWVITAAHCIDPQIIDSMGNGKIDVVLGTRNRRLPENGYERIGVKELYTHPEFRYDGVPWKDDIALLHLEKASTQSFVELPLVQDTMLYTDPYSELTIYGWGLSDTIKPDMLESSLPYSEILHSVQVDHIPMDICAATIESSGDTLPQKTFCAGYVTGVPRGAAAGDSGGPLAVKKNGIWTILGIVSGGQDIWTTQEHPGIFTEVAQHRRWINATMDGTLTQQKVHNKPVVQSPRRNYYVTLLGRRVDIDDIRQKNEWTVILEINNDMQRAGARLHIPSR